MFRERILVAPKALIHTTHVVVRFSIERIDPQGLAQVANGALEVRCRAVKHRCCEIVVAQPAAGVSLERHLIERGLVYVLTALIPRQQAQRYSEEHGQRDFDASGAAAFPSEAVNKRRGEGREERDARKVLKMVSNERVAKGINVEEAQRRHQRDAEQQQRGQGRAGMPSEKPAKSQR